jgi:hypothetical protein
MSNRSGLFLRLLRLISSNLIYDDPVSDESLGPCCFSRSLKSCCFNQNTLNKKISEWGVQVFLSSIQIWCIWELASTFPFQHRVFAIPMVERTHAFQGGKQFSCHSSPQVGRVQFLLLW